MTVFSSVELNSSCSGSGSHRSGSGAAGRVQRVAGRRGSAPSSVLRLRALALVGRLAGLRRLLLLLLGRLLLGILLLVLVEAGQEVCNGVRVGILILRKIKN